MHTNYDRKLFIKTTNRSMPVDTSSHYHPYEATSYPVLHTLFSAYKLEESDGFVDFGCGKGRLLFYVHNRFRSSVTGIEMNKQLYKKTIKNKMNYLINTKRNGDSIQVKCCLAEAYKVRGDDNKFYFFNPFSVQIFKNVIRNILVSVEQQPREVDVILYYPPQEYIDYLQTESRLKLVQEIKVPKLYNLNQNERFLIYRIQFHNDKK